MNNTCYLASVSALLLVVGLNASQAQTLTQKQTMAHEDPKLSEEAATASRICGSPITASFNWQSFVAADKIEDMNGAFRNPPSNMCGVPLKALQSMCQDAVAKQSIAAKVKSVECGYQDGATPTLALDPAGKLQYQSSFEAYQHPASGTPTDFVREWLGKHL